MTVEFARQLEFYKVQGCGNDFVAIDNRSGLVAENDMPELVRALCKRAFGIGADGAFFLVPAEQGQDADFAWHFYNSDSSRAEMCGNASRCATRLAFELGIAGKTMRFVTDAGIISAEYNEQAKTAKVLMTEASGAMLNMNVAIDGEDHAVHFVTIGVPHAVLIVPDVQSLDVKQLGHDVRFHDAFAPAGTNVNFTQVIDRQTMLLRTYERGVEDETYACGTGACSAVYLAHQLGLVDNDVELTTSGGEKLGVVIEGEDVYLKGGAEITFKGMVNLDSIGA